MRSESSSGGAETGAHGACVTGSKREIVEAATEPVTSRREPAIPVERAPATHYSGTCCLILLALLWLFPNALAAQQPDDWATVRVPGIEEIPSYDYARWREKRKATYVDGAPLISWWDAQRRCRREVDNIKKGEYETRKEYDARRQRLLEELSCERYWPLHDAILPRPVELSYNSAGAEFVFRTKLGRKRGLSFKEDGVVYNHDVCWQVESHWRGSFEDTVTASDAVFFDGRPSLSGGSWDGPRSADTPLTRCTASNRTLDLKIEIAAGIEKARQLKESEGDLELELHGRTERITTDGYARRGFQYSYVYMFWIAKVQLVNKKSGAVLFSAKPGR